MPPHVILPLAGIAVPMIVVPAVLFARHVGRVRHYRHMERMQALKSGVTPPSNVPLPGPGAIVAIGAGVPTVSVLGALAATLALPITLDGDDATTMLAIVWSASVFLGLCALATGLFFGLLLHRANDRAAAAARDVSAKPADDADLFAHDFR